MAFSGMEREHQTGRRKLSDGAQRKGIAGEEKPRMCGILFLAVALMPPRWRMFVSVPRVGEIRRSCEAPSAHPGPQRLPGGDSCLLPTAPPEDKAEEAPALTCIVLQGAAKIPANPKAHAPLSTSTQHRFGFFTRLKLSVSIWFLHYSVQPHDMFP